MKYFKLITAIFLSAILLAACSGNSAVNAGKDSTADNTSISEASSSGRDASFSCVLDGRKFSGTGTDEHNAAFLMTSGEDKGSIFFTLSDVNNPAGSLNFLVPGKVGTTTFDPNYKFSLTAYVTKDYINYVDNTLTVTINSITAAEIFGTFSGKYTLSTPNAGNAKSMVEVTDGKFDIPFSNSADWKKTYHAE